MGCSTLSLKEMPSVVRFSYRGWDHCTTVSWDANLTSAVLNLHILRVVGEEVEDPQCQVVVKPHVLQFPQLPQKCRLYGIESSGQIKEHDPDIVSRLL